MSAYELHHSIDFLIFRATEKILKAKSLDKSKLYYYSDFANDSGIINFLRRTYLEDGDFEKVFDLYQDSRLDPKSYRYETLITTLIVSIVGSVISEIIRDLYKKHKEKIIKLFDEKILRSIKKIPENIQSKFIKGETESIKADLNNLLNCYAARFMHERHLIDTNSYDKLVTHFIHGSKIGTDLLQQFNQFMEKYRSEKKSINVDVLYLMIDAYSRGVFSQYLAENNGDSNLFEKIETSNTIFGYPVYAGICKGKIVKGINNKMLSEKNVSSYKKILCVRGDLHHKYLEKILICNAVVTWSVWELGHVPLFCRSRRIPCVIIEESSVGLLIDNDDIAINAMGTVYLGEIVEKIP